MIKILPTKQEMKKKMLLAGHEIYRLLAVQEMVKEKMDHQKKIIQNKLAL